MRIEFRLRNIRVADADGDVVAMAPLAGVSVELPGAAARPHRARTH